MKRRCHHRKIDRDLEQLNQNLNTIIQNQNELYCKLEQLYAIVTSLDSLDGTDKHKGFLTLNKERTLHLSSDAKVLSLF